MVVPYPQPVQPWSGDPEEERRFRRILLIVLLLFSVMGYLVPNWTLPRIELPWELDLPPRIARVMAERSEPVARQTPSGPVVAPEPASAPQMNTQPEAQEIPADTAGQVQESEVREPAPDRVAQAGVLALSDRLAALRGSASQSTFAETVPGKAAGERRQGSRQPARLTSGVTGGSEGLGAATLAPRDVLGDAGLPEKAVAGIQPGSPGGSALRSSVNRPDNGRSQEEIQEILDRNKRSIYALYNRELRFDPTLRGKVVLSITIAPSGEVSECRVVSSELNAPSLEKKLVLLIKGIDFGAKPGVPSVTANLPIEFFPA